MFGRSKTGRGGSTSPTDEIPPIKPGPKPSPKKAPMPFFSLKPPTARRNSKEAAAEAESAQQQTEWFARPGNEEKIRKFLEKKKKKEEKIKKILERRAKKATGFDDSGKEIIYKGIGIEAAPFFIKIEKVGLTLASLSLII